MVLKLCLFDFGSKIYYNEFIKHRNDVTILVYSLFYIAFSRKFVSSVPAHVEMMGLIGAGNNPMVGMTVACAVAIEEASK